MAELNIPYRDAAGTSSTYHQFRTSRGNPNGLVVYLDGDGMYGHNNPSSSWALGGPNGVVNQANLRGYDVVSVKTPAKDGTFWRAGDKNAAYVASLVRTFPAIAFPRVWLVGYSGGSQLITQFLLPGHSGDFTRGGGAVICGGGGRPRNNPSISDGLKTGFPMLWYTGLRDTAANSEDGYDALGDARAGQSWYASKGLTTTLETPSGLDHDDLGGKFGTVLAGQLDRYPYSPQTPPVDPPPDPVADEELLDLLAEVVAANAILKPAVNKANAALTEVSLAWNAVDRALKALNLHVNP